MTRVRRLLCFSAFGVGLLGSIACVGAIFSLFNVSSRLWNATENVFAKSDNLLNVVQQQVEQVYDRVKRSVLTTEEIAGSLRDWTKREASQRLAQQLELEERAKNLHETMSQADHWLKVSRSSAELVQQVFILSKTINEQVDTGFVDGLVEELASLQNQLEEATTSIVKLQEWAVAVKNDESGDDRSRPAVQLARHVIIGLSSIDSRLEKLEHRVSDARRDLQSLRERALAWYRIITTGVAMLIMWIAAGQVALCQLARKDMLAWRRTPL